jgi:hypothetical protein
LYLESAENYTHITANRGDSPRDAETFIYWQTENTRLPPVKRTVLSDVQRVSENTDSRVVLDNLSMRFPLRSVSVLGNRALFLDSVGNITVVSTETGLVEFTFSVAGSLDATFLDSNNIIVGRSAGDTTPFFRINTATGETVPLAYNAPVGARIYRGDSGTLYGAVITRTAGRLATSIIRLSLSNPAQSAVVAEYPGEDTGFGIAESSGIIAAAIGGDGAYRYGTGGGIPFERSPGLPVRLINGGAYFITIDEEGSLSWHDNQTGKRLALLRLYQNEWVLELPGGQRVRGTVVYR